MSESPGLGTSRLQRQETELVFVERDSPVTNGPPAKRIKKKLSAADLRKSAVRTEASESQGSPTGLLDASGLRDEEIPIILQNNFLRWKSHGVRSYTWCFFEPDHGAFRKSDPDGMTAVYPSRWHTSCMHDLQATRPTSRYLSSTTRRRTGERGERKYHISCDGQTRRFMRNCQEFHRSGRDCCPPVTNWQETGAGSASNVFQGKFQQSFAERFSKRATETIPSRYCSFVCQGLETFLNRRITSHFRLLKSSTSSSWLRI